MTLLALLAAAFLATLPQAGPDSSRTVSGRWQINQQYSEDLRTLMAGPDSSRGTRPGPGMRPGPGGGPGGPGGTGGRPGSGGPGGGGPRRGGPEGRRPSPQAMAAQRALTDLAGWAPATLTLEESDTEFVIITPRDSVALPTNGRKIERPVNDSTTVELRARRRDGRLAVERKIDGASGTITETYFLSATREQLFVVIRVALPNMPEPMLFRRIYDRASAP